MKQIGEVFSKLEIAASADFLKTIVPSEPLRTEENSFEATNQNFDESFKGSLMRHGIYNNCGFTNVNLKERLEIILFLKILNLKTANL